MRTLSRVILVALLCAITLSQRSPVAAAGGTFPLGICLDATHQTMGPGQAVQAPEYFDPLTASDAERACYGFPARPAGGEDLRRWTIGMHALPLPKDWIISPSTVLPASSSFAAAHSGHRAFGTIGQGRVNIYGGYTVKSNAVDNYNPFYLAQGQWKIPSPYNYDDHVVSQWIGLGCCFAADNQLLQTGTYFYTPGGNTVKSGFFWEVPGHNSMVTYGPAISITQVAAAVVEEYSTGTYFEACNETANQCSWTPFEPYRDVAGSDACAGNSTGSSTCAPYVEEDTGVYNTFQTSDDPPYYNISWGPALGPANQNVVDAVGICCVSYPIGSLDDFIEAMNANTIGSFPAYLYPAAIDSNTNFNICGRGYYYYNGWVPTTC